MPLSEAVLNLIKCCLSNDGHILIDADVLKCTSSACRECISNSLLHLQWKKNDLLNATVNTVAKILVENFIADLFEKRIKSISENDLVFI